MKYYNTILDTRGNTPLVKLNAVTAGIEALVLAKVEYLNPGGSTKDRMAVAMIEDAEQKGLLGPGGTIVEPTSGNTGMGLAMIAALKGYKAIFTMPDKINEDKANALRAFGAEVIYCPTSVAPDDPQSYYEVAKALVANTPGAFSPNQYFNPANPRAHYESTGPEIWKDTAGKITHFVAGMGTGGTLSGAGKYLKEQNSELKIVGADPEGSIYHHEFYGTEGEIHTYKTEGIGEDFMPDTMDLSLVDDIIVVTDQQSFDMTRRLAHEEALFVGESSGTAVHAAVEYARAHSLTKDDVMVVLLPDTGRNYLRTAFNDQWLKNNGL